MGETNPLISIVIPTFNSAVTIDRCLASVVSQTYDNVEIIIVDGLSTDDTISNINRILSVNETKSHRLVSESDRGIYDAMNKGIKFAKGDWIYFLGSDDYLMDEFVLERFVDLLGNEEYDFVYGDVIAPDYGGFYDGPFDEKKILNKNICHQAIFFKKSLFAELGLYKIKYPLLADYEFNIRCIFNGKVRKRYINLTIAFYAPAGSSKTKVDEQFLKDKSSIIFKVLLKNTSIFGRLNLHKSRLKNLIRSRFVKK